MSVKAFFMTLIGLLALPVFWALQKLGIAQPPAALSPSFEALNRHLFRCGISLVGEMQTTPLNGVKEWALLRYGFNPSTLLAVTVALSETEELAQQVESEVRSAPQYTGVRRNGRLIMGCTFNPPDPQLEQAIGEAFMSLPSSATESAGQGR